MADGIPAHVERTSTGHRHCACGCGAVVEALSRTVRYASAECAERSKRERARVRSAAAYSASKSYLNARRWLRTHNLLTPESLARLEVLRGMGGIHPARARKLAGLPKAAPYRFVRADPWQLPAPAREGHVPGCGPCRLDLHPHTRIDERSIKALHGLLTALDGRDHHETDPRWSLAPCDGGCGWAVTWRDDAGAHLADTVRAVDLRGSRRLLTLDPGAPIPWPSVPRGRSCVELSTLTPVSIRRTVRDARGERVGSVAGLTMSAETLTSGLVSLADFLGAGLTRDQIRVEVLSDETDPASVRVDRSGRVGEGGRVRGWEGRCVLTVNAPARWLLEIASAGWGLGGKTAFGFGAVRVREVP